MSRLVVLSRGDVAAEPGAEVELSASAGAQMAAVGSRIARLMAIDLHAVFMVLLLFDCFMCQ